MTPHHLTASQNELVSVSVDVSTLNGRVHCTFLEAFLIAFWRRSYCEIRLGTDPTFNHLELKQQSREIAIGGETASINIDDLSAATTYFYNISIILEDRTIPVVVIQGFVTTPISELRMQIESYNYKWLTRFTRLLLAPQSHLLQRML